MNRDVRENEARIIEEAKLGKTGRELAGEFGVSPSTISNVFRKHGFEPPKGRRQTCELDHAAFDVISEHSAYWLGFFCADGSSVDNSSGSPQIVFTLATRDEGHIEKFRLFLKSTHGITRSINKTSKGYRDGEGGKASHFRVRSKQLYAAICRRGMGVLSPLRVPTHEIENSPDFWRGEVDGDGTVRWTTDRAGNTYAHIILCGHMPLIEKFQAFLLRHKIIANITDTASGIYQIRLMGSPALTVIELLYGNATVALDRKWAVAREIIKTHGRFPKPPTK